MNVRVLLKNKELEHLVKNMLECLKITEIILAVVDLSGWRSIFISFKPEGEGDHNGIDSEVTDTAVL